MVVHPEKIDFCNDLIDFIVCFEYQCSTMCTVLKAA